MPIYTEPDEPDFARLEAHFRWVPAVVEAEYGERETPNPDAESVPAELNWLSLLPESVRWDLETVECALAYEDTETGYTATVWDASGEDDFPWAVLLADDFGVRLLAEYSVLDEEADETALEKALANASEALPDRLLAGEFHRTGTVLALPEYLLTIIEELDEL